MRMKNIKRISSFFLMAVVVLLIFPVSSLAAPITSANGSKGKIEFKEDVKEVIPVDPTDPEKPIDPPQPPTPGPLSLSFVPNLRFEKQKISKKDQTYYALPTTMIRTLDGQEKEVVNFVQFTNNKGASAKWELTLAQVEPLTNEKGFQLENTKFKFRNLKIKSLDGMNTIPMIPQNIDVPSNGDAIRVADNEQGDADPGTWQIEFGELGSTAEEAIGLFIPGSTKKEEGKYQTKLLWTFKEVL